MSLENRSLTWQGKHVPAGSAIFPGNTCPVVGAIACDNFALTVDVDAAHWETSEGGVEVSISWPDPNNDFHLYIFDENGELVAQSTIDNRNAGVAEEKAFIENASGTYDVLVNAFTVVNSGYDGRVVLHSSDAPPDADDELPPGGTVPRKTSSSSHHKTAPAP